MVTGIGVNGSQDGKHTPPGSDQVGGRKIEAGLRAPSENPAVVLLAKQAKSAVGGVRSALTNCARLLSGNGALRWPDVDWTALRYGHVEALKRQLTDRYEPNTVNRHLSALKGVAAEAWRLGLLPHEEFARIKEVRRVRPSGKLAGRQVAGAELEKLFGALPSSAAGDRDAALLVVLYAAGLRRSELTGLALADWKPDAAQLLVQKGKGGKYREVFLDGAAGRMVDRWVVWRGPWEGPLFCPVHRSGTIQRRGMTPTAVALLVGKLSKRHGLEKFTPHDLRRTFASAHLDAGTDIATVRDLMGHEDINTTARYDRRGDEAKRRAAKAVHIPFRRDGP